MYVDKVINYNVSEICEYVLYMLGFCTTYNLYKILSRNLDLYNLVIQFEHTTQLYTSLFRIQLIYSIKLKTKDFVQLVVCHYVTDELNHCGTFQS